MHRLYVKFITMPLFAIASVNVNLSMQFFYRFSMKEQPGMGPLVRRMFSVDRCRAARTALAFTLGVLLFWNPATAEEFTIHAGPNGYAPFFMIDKSGDEPVYSGAIYDLLDAFEAQYPQYKRKSILLTRKRANVRMARGEVFDVMFNSPLFVSDEILKHYRFTQSMFVSRDVVITRKDQNFEYRKPEDLYNKSVSTIRGYGYGDFDRLLESGLIRDTRVDQHEQAIGMLIKKRVDAYFGNIYVSPHYMKKMGLNVSDFNFSEVSMYEFDFAFAVNKKKPELFDKLDAFVGDSVAEGLVDRIFKGYIE